MEKEQKFMIDKRFGEAFRQLRQERKKTLSAFESKQIAKSCLSRFERGESSLDVDKFFVALELMGLQLFEFEQNYLKRGRNGFKKDFDVLCKAYYHEDLELLYSYYEGAKGGLEKLALRCILLDHSAPVEPLSNEERDKLEDFLFGCEHWGIYEFSILQFSLGQLDKRRIIALLKMMLDLSEEHAHIPIFRSYMVQAILKACYKLLQYPLYQKDCKDLLKKAYQLLAFDDFFLKNMTNFVAGLYILRFECQEEGLDRVERALQVFEQFSRPELAKYFRNLAYKIIKIPD